MTHEYRLPCGRVVLIDAEDVDLISQHRWYFKVQQSKSKRTGYAYGQVGKKKTYMHRIIMGATEGQIIDHINNDGLDNRKANLRFCTQSENNFNRITIKTKGLRKVSALDSQRTKSGVRYRARVSKNGQMYCGHWYSDAAEAKAEHDVMSLFLHGPVSVTYFDEKLAVAAVMTADRLRYEQHMHIPLASLIEQAADWDGRTT